MGNISRPINLKLDLALDSRVVPDSADLKSLKAAKLLDSVSVADIAGKSIVGINMQAYGY